MATYTENYNLTMPEEADYYNAEDFNTNFETIDTLMAENEAVCNEINEKIGTPDEGETVFSLLKNSGGSFIKSIQTVKATHSTGSEGKTTLKINTINPNKCIILIDRLQDSSSNRVLVSYTLTATTLTVNTNSYADGGITVQFQIIEFY